MNLVVGSNFKAVSLRMRMTFFVSIGLFLAAPGVLVGTAESPYHPEYVGLVPMSWILDEMPLALGNEYQEVRMVNVKDPHEPMSKNKKIAVFRQSPDKTYIYKMMMGEADTLTTGTKMKPNNFDRPIDPRCATSPLGSDGEGKYIIGNDWPGVKVAPDGPSIYIPYEVNLNGFFSDDICFKSRSLKEICFSRKAPKPISVLEKLERNFPGISVNKNELYHALCSLVCYFIYKKAIYIPCVKDGIGSQLNSPSLLKNIASCLFSDKITSDECFDENIELLYVKQAGAMGTLAYLYSYWHWSTLPQSSDLLGELFTKVSRQYRGGEYFEQIEGNFTALIEHLGGTVPTISSAPASPVMAPTKSMCVTPPLSGAGSPCSQSSPESVSAETSETIRVVPGCPLGAPAVSETAAPNTKNSRSLLNNGWFKQKLKTNDANKELRQRLLDERDEHGNPIETVSIDRS